MVPGSRRTGLNSSRLVRLLAGLATADETASPQGAIAQRLGQWLDWTDAIPLSTVLGSAAVPAAGAGAGAGARTGTAASSAPAKAATAATAATAALARVRAELSRAITAEAVFTAARPAAAGHEAGDAADGADRDAFAPYRRSCQRLQRAMAGRIAPLRQQVRATLGQASPRLARLAALDAVMDEWLAARERSLLDKVPALLERRCGQLRQQAPQDWPARLGAEVQDVLLAELDVRLQAVEGLIEALGQETT